MQNKRHRIQFPKTEVRNLAQDEVYFYLISSEGEKTKIRFHDYGKIYEIPGLYEQVLCDRLKCKSPEKVAEKLKSAVDQAHENFSELRVFDLGAGNGLMGEALNKYGVSRLIGADIIPEAKTAAERDRPHLYDAYYIADLCDLTDEEKEEFASWSLNCLTVVGALGFGDIPPHAFMEAFNTIHAQGWVAFNIKDTFLNESDDSGFSRLIRELIFSKYLDLYNLERYRHRLSMEGEPLYYFAIAARKNADISPEFFERYSR